MSVQTGIDVKLQADASQLKSELDSAAKTLTSLKSGVVDAGLALEGFSKKAHTGHSPVKLFGESLREVGTVALGMAGGNFLSGGIEGVARFAEQIMSSVGAIEDLGAATGVSWKRLQELQFAAAQSGAGVGELQTGIKSLQMVLSDDEPTEKAKTALDTLGLSFAELKAASPEDQFDLVLASLGKLPPGAERTAAAVDLLGKSGVKLLPLVENLDELTAKANEFGAVMSDDTIKAVKAFDDALVTSKMTMQAWAGNALGAVSQVASAFGSDGIMALFGNLKVSTTDEIAAKFGGKISSAEIEKAKAERQAKIDAAEEITTAEQKAEDKRIAMEDKIAADERARATRQSLSEVDSVIDDGRRQMAELEQEKKVKEARAKLDKAIQAEIDGQTERQMDESIKLQKDNVRKAEAEYKRAQDRVDQIRGGARGYGFDSWADALDNASRTDAERKADNRIASEDQRLREKLASGQRLNSREKRELQDMAAKEAEAQALANAKKRDADKAAGILSGVEQAAQNLENAKHLAEIEKATINTAKSLGNLERNLRVVDI